MNGKPAALKRAMEKGRWQMALLDRWRQELCGMLLCIADATQVLEELRAQQSVPVKLNLPVMLEAA
jgi:hypothetical protein